jgi:two-component system, NarL family, response regulator DesR
VSTRPRLTCLWDTADFGAQRYTSRMHTTLEPIRVVIAEDNEDLCVAVCALLQSEPDIEVVATIDRAEALLDAVRAGDARVVVLDLNLGGHSSVPAMEAMRREMPRVAVVIYSGYDRHDVADAVPAGGAVEFVSKSGEVTELLRAVRRVGG